jgi:hypothetical protein
MLISLMGFGLSVAFMVPIIGGSVKNYLAVFLLTSSSGSSLAFFGGAGGKGTGLAGGSGSGVAAIHIGFLSTEMVCPSKNKYQVSFW